MRRKLIVTIILIILFICLSNFVRARDYGELEEKRNEIQNQINQQEEQKKQIEINLSKNLEQINSLDERISNYEVDLEKANTDLDEIYKEIEKAEIGLNNIESEYQIQKKNLEQRLVALYEAGETSYLDVLLKSSSLSEFVSSYFLISEIAEYDKDLLDNIEREKNLIEELNKILTNQKVNLKQIRNSREKTIIALENAKVIRNSYIAKLSKEEIETQEKINGYIEELNRVEAEILAIATRKFGRRVCRRSFCLAGSRILYSNFKIWNENTSNIQNK